MTVKFMEFHVPTDEALLRAIAVASIRHAHLDHILRMTIKVLAQVSAEEAVLGTAMLGSAALRKRIRKLARRELGGDTGTAFLKLEAILERCKLATDRRNTLVHGLFGKQLDGEPQMRTRERWGPMPTVPELEELSDRLKGLTDELNEARLNGFLAEALIKCRLGTSAPAKQPAEWGNSGS